MTVMTTSLLPQLTGSMMVAPNVTGLNPDDQVLILGLSAKLNLLSYTGLVRESYYNGLQRLADLGVSIPPQLSSVRTVVDWPRICVDPLVQRCVVDGFRLPSDVDVDDDLTEIWQANDLDAEAPLCFLDSLVQGRGYMIVGAPDTPGDSPIITVESPLNLAMNWDPRTRKALAAYQAYQAEGLFRAVLYKPNYDIKMSRDSTKQMVWQVDDVDEHNFGEVCVVRFPNRQRSADREGQSEITPAVMNTTDSACRSLLGMEIAREFYSVPHRYILGAKESDFQDAAGNPKSAIDMVMSKMLAFENDDQGNGPTVGQFQAFDPSVFTKILDSHAQLMASYTQFPPAYFGQTTTANPASADAIHAAQDGVNRRGSQVQNQFSDPLERVMRLAWRFANGGQQVPVEMRRLETDWVDVGTATPEGTSMALHNQIQAGSVPPTSDVVLRRLGYSAVERARLTIDRRSDQGAGLLAELANSLLGKDARVDKAIAADLTPTVPGTAGQPTPTPPATIPAAPVAPRGAK